MIYSKHPLATTQEKTLHMDITRWSTPKSDWLYSLQPKMEKLIQSAKTRPEAGCGSDHELFTAKFRLKLKKAGKRLTEFCKEKALVIASTLFQQHKKKLYTWTSPEVSIPKSDWLYIFAANDGEALYSQQTTLGADCGSDHELFIAKFGLKLKKSGKTTRSFRYNLT